MEMNGVHKAISTGGTIRIGKGNPGTSRSSTDEHIEDFSFAKFAATYFQSNVTGEYSKSRLKKSLLQHDFPLDEIASQAIWIMIMRFMGNEVESKTSNDEENSSLYSTASGGHVTYRSSVMQSLTQTLNRKQTQSQEFKDAMAAMGGDGNQNQKLIRKTLKRKNKLPEMLRKTLDTSDEIDYYQQMLNARSSNLDKLHFIIGHGLLRIDLRDEILAQICKQLTKNPDRSSYAKGWMLLSLCIGCFPPSERFEPYLRCFLRNGPTFYATYCENRLERTLANGARTQPPAWLELQAIRNKTPMALEIHLADGSVKRLQVDAASTAKECVEHLASNIGLEDYFGFSIIITIYDKMMSIGSGREHILDAISHCEQYCKEQGQDERKAPWKLYFRKEMFAPWYDPSQDELATQLIYKQIVRGLYSGEYRCRSEKDIAKICALEYYAENGDELNATLLRQRVSDFIPKYLLSSGEKSLETWEILITKAFQSNEYVIQKAPQNHAKEDICLFAKLTWPMLFSRFFEAVRIAGPQLLSDSIVIAVNSTGLFYIDESEQILAELSFAEISCVSVEAPKDFSSNIDLLHIDTIQKENFTFKCFEAHDIVELINFLLENLKLFSKFGIVLEDFTPDEELTRLGHMTLRKGDLVQFESGVTGAMVMNSQQSAARGICNNVSGEFLVKYIKVLPCLMRPTNKVIQIYRERKIDDDADSNELLFTKYNTIQRSRMHTLQKFAEEHFRPNFASGRADVWRYSSDVLKAPLLKQLQDDHDNFPKALDMFLHILKYAGDVPNGDLLTNNTDRIFGPALECEMLRNELFCQLMKQLTQNRFEYSEERYWDLMYLATGIMHPDTLIIKELQEFLRTRDHVLAAECIQRIRHTTSNGQRKRPPHAIEVEAIQRRFMHIYHKIYFPDNTDEAFEIESFTKAMDLSQSIAERLVLKSCEGFSLFVQIGDKVFSIAANEFVFDYISELATCLLQDLMHHVNDAQIASHYQLYYLKKLWINVVPGEDPNADNIFHYSQELSKYLNGYYKIDKQTAIELASVVYVLEYENDMGPLQRIHEVLPHVVPEDRLKLLKSPEWRKHILQGIKLLMENGEIGDESALKLIFLKAMAKQKTFGSTFFLVQQTNEQEFPEWILIAINLYGFHIVHAETKKILRSYDYNELSFWSSGNTYFHIRFGNMIGASKLLCTTSQGYKIDDLLNSYIDYIKEIK